MLRTFIDFQLFKHCSTERSSRKHAFYRKAKGSFWMFHDLFFESRFFQTTGIFRVTIVLFTTGFVTSDSDFLCIDNNDVIASIYVRNILRT